MKSAWNISILLCLWGNYFLSKYQGIQKNHINNHWHSRNTYKFDIFYKRIWETNQWKLKRRDFSQHCQELYCPLNLEPQVLSLECVRQISIKPPGKRLWHPKSWIPPVTACIDKCCKSHQLPNSILTYILETCCKTFWLIDWCLTPILEIFPIYRGIRFFGKNEHRFNA